MSMSFAFGVDIGGSHITSALVNLEKGQPVPGSESRMDVNSGGIAEDILSAWSAAIRISLGKNPDLRIPIGIAMPGPFDYDNGISLILEQDKFKSLYKLPLKELLAERLGMDPFLIHFMNDACGFLEGEMMGGALRDQKDVMGVTLGTGLGSAFSQNGDVIDADLWKAPFKDGIAEDYLSTRWFSGRFLELTGKKISGVKELVEIASQETATVIVFREFAENLAEFMADQYNQHRYSNIVLGGNIARAADFFSAHCESHLASLAPGARYCIAELWEIAPLIGAAGMASRKSTAWKNQLLKINTA